MSGKAYTQSEMKGIVNYLIEHKAYKSLKGRKTWMEFANSSRTNRTWQSLKETFLKRILPDISNPYYNLTMEQICSFQQRKDVTAREQIKLETHTMSDASSYADNEKDIEQPSTSKAHDAEKISGEDIKHSKISSRNRASVETIVLGNCYETNDDLLRDLESPNIESKAQTEVPKSPTKSLRDLITYSEPLTPMLQDVLHDFATDDDSDSGEPRMQIVENVRGCDHEESGSPKRLPYSPNKSVEKNGDKSLQQDSDDESEFVPPKVKSLRLRKRQGVYVPVSDGKSPSKKLDINDVPEGPDQPSLAKKAPLEEVSELVILNNSNEKRVHEITKTHGMSTQNCSNSTTDTVLPNNQEALDNTKLEEPKKSSNETSKTDSKDKSKVTRKRAISQNMSSDSHLQGKTIHSKTSRKQVSMSDSDIALKKLQVNKEANSTKLLINKQPQETNDTNKSPDIETQDILPPNKPVDNQEMVTPSQTSQINPCLQSVSLFAEQFNLTNVNSESSGNEKKAPAKGNQKKTDEVAGTTENVAVDVINKVVMLKSHSETDSGTSKEQVIKQTKVLQKTKRNNALANVFGFSSGGVTTKRRKRNSFRQRSSSHHHQRSESSGESSEWTSESDSDYVSPPRGRRNRMGRKYLKPRSARVHSLEEEGGLFVMYGKKIYPLVKDGKTVKNYLFYSHESDPEEDENNWKRKYEQEKRRVEELKTFIQQDRQNIIRDSSPVLPTKPRNQTADDKHNQGTTSKSVPCLHCDKEHKEVGEVKELTREPKNKTLKITFAKNDQKLYIEGDWTQLHPALADVVEIFHKDVEAYKETANKKDEPDRAVDTASDKSSVILIPPDEDVHEKVNKLETEIFKEIEERDQEERVHPIEGNVTRRKRIKRMSTSSSDASKRSKVTVNSKVTDIETAKVVEKNIEGEKNIEEENSDLAKGRETPSIDTIDSKASTPPKQKRTPRKSTKRTTTEEAKTVTVTQNKPRTRKATNPPPQKIQDEKLPHAEETLPHAEEKLPHTQDDEAEIRYMLPPTKKSTSKPATNVRKTRRSSIEIPKIYTSSNVSLNSESRDYLDSDTSPPKVLCRRKRRLSLSTVISKNRNKHKRMKKNSCPVITNDVSSDSNNSYHIILKTTDDCSLKSDEYRSESYQLLMPHSKNTFIPLVKIEENSPVANAKLHSKGHCTLSNLKIVKDNVCTNINDDLTSSGNTDFVNSSSVSLPMSPELSIVESLSVSQKLITSVNSQPTLNEIHANDLTENVVQNKYVISQIDVSMPLMQQECGVHRSFHGTLPADYTCNETKDSVVSESFLKKVNTVNIGEAPTLSISLDQRLKDLLLESAKKMSMPEDKVGNQIVAVNKEENIKKPRAKRCSTPRKRKETKKTKLPTVDPVIEEQHMETFSYGGRKSCPPSIQMIGGDNAVNDIQNNNTDKESLVKDKPKATRRKKDIIKVKILKPKSKPQKSEINQKNAKSSCRTSVPADSGINDYESGLSIQDLSDSIDLIHNHSETCLHANDCIGDSVEFMELTAKSVVSVNSSASCDCKSHQVFKNCEDLPEMFCHIAQDCISSQNAVETFQTQSTGNTVYLSPVQSEKSLNSLITEDLSDEFAQPSQSTKWYLLSEDDTNVTGMNAGGVWPQNTNLGSSSYGSSLKQLFPIACAVPDLSTITEMSKENDETNRKPILDLNCDSNTMNDVDSQNIFDMNL